jgi:MFS family permease
VSSYIGGEAVGSVATIYLGDKLGRTRYMQVLSILVTIAVIIQTAAVNMPMFLAGRALAGIAVGSVNCLQNLPPSHILTDSRGMYSTVPVYLSEIAAPNLRGLVGGLSGLGISCGIMVSNWVGFACGYAPYGQLQWRLPLAMQAPWGIMLFVGLTTFIPDSPRHLIRVGNVPAARNAFERVRPDLGTDEAEREFVLMQSQIEYERERELKSYGEVFRLYQHRAFWYASFRSS